MQSHEYRLQKTISTVRTRPKSKERHKIKQDQGQIGLGIAGPAGMAQLLWRSGHTMMRHNQQDAQQVAVGCLLQVSKQLGFRLVQLGCFCRFFTRVSCMSHATIYSQIRAMEHFP